MSTLTIRLNRRRCVVESQAFRPQPFTRFEWATLIASAMVASGTIWLAFAFLLALGAR